MAVNKVDEDIVVLDCIRVQKREPKAKPFVKWAGGKGQSLNVFARLYPRNFDTETATYYEPFLGGGAVFFDLQPANAVLADLNEGLILSYLAVRDSVDELISLLEEHEKEHEADEGYYYWVRSLNGEGPDPLTMSTVRKAARLIYLNKTCYNGLYRVNSAGQFNVPKGKYKRPAIVQKERLLACSNLLEGVKLKNTDFKKAVLLGDKPAKEGDFVYFDPPYHPVSETANFTDYTQAGFGEADQERLADTFRELDERGVFVMLSNSDTPFIRRLYSDYSIYRIEASRAINSKASRRGRIGELVITNYKTGDVKG